jgi:hypothetical protein
MCAMEKKDDDLSEIVSRLRKIEAKALEKKKRIGKPLESPLSIAFENEVSRLSIALKIDGAEARKAVRLLSSIDQFASEIAELMDMPHCEATAVKARERSAIDFADRKAIQEAVQSGFSKKYLAQIYSLLHLSKENIQRGNLSDAIGPIVHSARALLIALAALAEEKRSKAATLAADALHNKPGGHRQKRAAIRATWASGKYTSRDVCAEQECAALGMSFSAARKALRNTPNPT